jgi:N-acetyl-gamma-glutamyl-phosphate reductase
MKSVYIAGRSGTSGLVLHELVRPRTDLHLLAPDVQGRDALDRETELLNAADVVVLCLPPAAVSAALARITNPSVRVIDNSTVHSTANGWVFGLPELHPGQRSAIRTAHRVAGPGCFATGVILALRPLVDRRLLDPTAPVCIQGIAGYSAGGKRMVEWYEWPRDGAAQPPVKVFGLNLHHAQVPEMQRYTGLQKPPLFVPWVGHFPRGVLVSIPLHRDWLGTAATPASVREALQERYASERLVSVPARNGLVSSLALSATMGRGAELFVEGNEEHLLVLARLDNLGKGSAIATIQNMNLLLGCNEFAGLEGDALRT